MSSTSLLLSLSLRGKPGFRRVKGYESGPGRVEFICRKLGSPLRFGESERHVQIMGAMRADRRDVMNGECADDRVSAADAFDIEVPDELKAYSPRMAFCPFDRARMPGDEKSAGALDGRLVRGCVLACHHVASMRIGRRHRRSHKLASSKKPRSPCRAVQFCDRLLRPFLSDAC